MKKNIIIFNIIIIFLIVLINYLLYPKNKIKKTKLTKTTLENNYSLDSNYHEKINNQKLEIINRRRKEYWKNHIITIGNSGSEVRFIQQCLKKLNYPVNIDGYYGFETINFIKEIQYKSGLFVDGIVGNDTLEKLKNTNDQNLKYHKPEYIYTTKNHTINNDYFSSFTPYFIWVDLTKHEVSIFKGSCKNWKLITTFPCTIGAPSSPTIKGMFTLNSKGPELKLDYCIVKYYSQISGNYLFHSILYDFNGNVLDGRIGYSLSHGCIRLKTEDAKYIYDNIPIKTSIYIY